MSGEPDPRGARAEGLQARPEDGDLCVLDAQHSAKAMPSVRLTIEARLASDTMGAKGDNCPGWYA